MQPGAPPYGGPQDPQYGQPDPYAQPAAPAAAPAAAAAPVVVVQQQQQQQPVISPYSQPVVGGGGGFHMYPSTSAGVALGLGIGALSSYIFGGCCCNLICIIGIILNVIGLIMAYQAKGVVSMNPGHPDTGQAGNAVMVNWIAVGIAVVVTIILVIYVFVLMNDPSFGSGY